MNDFIIILSKNKNNYTNSLDNFFKLSGLKSLIINDEDKDFVSISNFFRNLTNVKNGDPSAWEKSFYYLYNNKEILSNFDQFYFIEDDVYSKNLNTFKDFIFYLKNNSSALVTNYLVPKDLDNDEDWWKRHYTKNFKNPYRSFNPICRLSSKLIKVILKYIDKEKTFCFHEILFPSIAIENNFTIFDCKKNNTPHLGKIVYRPVIDISSIVDNKIYHPIKQ